MERVLLIPYEVRPSKYANNYEAKSRASSDDVNQRKFYRCLGVCSLFMFFLVLAYVPVTYHQTRSLQVNSPSAIIVGWSRNTSRDLKVYVLPNNVTTLIHPTEVCSSPLFLLVIVCSAVQNADARLAIRETWASTESVRNTSIPVRVMFLLGDPDNATMQEYIEEENRQFGDLIQEGFVDSYNNLTVKSVMMLKWVASRCPKVRYVMKTDDDMYVNVGSLLRFLLPRSSNNLLVGSLICSAKPITDPASKWFTPRYLYSGRLYPNYLSGTGYVMSRDVAMRLYKAALNTPLLHLEDVYVTGICSRAANVRPRDNGAFTFGHRKLDPCVYRSDKVITSHRVSPTDLRNIWLQMASTTAADCAAKPVTTLAPAQKSKQKVAAMRKQVNKCF